ncbi:hypothetical protein C1H46_014724 [Malus baccata]|uniref:Uncharacterized protein n=1 Tax=Malus baccata TaxID=106549 RepID=A0A540MLG7_MALBA|nr:hypothetical protein C1H46_014724 [Malus baccata]
MHAYSSLFSVFDKRRRTNSGDFKAHFFPKLHAMQFLFDEFFGEKTVQSKVDSTSTPPRKCLGSSEKKENLSGDEWAWQ